MKTTLLLLVYLLTVSCTFAQIIVKNAAYKANFSNEFHQPRYVSYTLYKGGGNCPRDGFSFKCGDDRLLCATDAEYSGTGYDKGHLVNAEDFAFDCKKDELTFRYYNCLPQTANLNRGKWKANETLIRKWSQTQKLYIVCGGFFGSKKMGSTTVPSYCWKVVQSVKTKEVLYCGWFTNSKTATEEEISVTELGKRLHSRIILLK